MADEERKLKQQEVAESAESEDDGSPTTTPFDHPFFLPVLLWGLAAWFGYDIFTNAEAYQKYPNFNRGGLVVFTTLAVYFTRSAIQEMREDRES